MRTVPTIENTPAYGPASSATIRMAGKNVAK
jgi:hypothetical protein